MNNKKLMSYEAFNELIDNLEYVDHLTKYGRENIKYHVQKLQEENISLRNRIKTIKRQRKKSTQKVRKYKEIITDFQSSLEHKNKIIKEASNILKKGIEFCINDSHNTYEKCNIAINREKDILKILKESESKE